ncbi:MAG: hypothetical protein CML02_18190 [Pseudooceanicola sp.]|jgi:hypothetical protein|nr:hypothetical protein [Pseudooceanicola sp.]|tara:strand:- start:1977 stop:2357 length:381 start_codon:yes stop_codon:yes gene_type:complete
MVTHGPNIGPRPLSFFLTRFAEELRILKSEGQTVEEAIGESLLEGGANPRDTLANLQKIDLVVQSLGELSTYLETMVISLPIDPELNMDDAFRQITLRDLARTLSGGWRKPVVDSSGETTGEVELF